MKWTTSRGARHSILRSIASKWLFKITCIGRAISGNSCRREDITSRVNRRTMTSDSAVAEVRRKTFRSDKRFFAEVIPSFQYSQIFDRFPQPFQTNPSANDKEKAIRFATLLKDDLFFFV